MFLLALYAKLDLLPWMDLPRALPLTTFLALAIFIALLAKYARQMESWQTFLPMVLWATFALALLPKMFLNVHLYHVGFYMAMPATLVLLICLTYWIPKLLKKRWGCGVAFRSLALAILVAASVYHLTRSHKIYKLKNFAVGKGGDMILTYGPKVRISGRVTALALEWIEEKTPREATFVGLPEGIMLNYLSRRAITLPYVNFMMPEIITFGEKRIVDDFKARPPDYVMLVDNDPSEFGVGQFGDDPRYGKKIMDWVNQYYEPVALDWQRTATGPQLRHQDPQTQSERNTQVSPFPAIPLSRTLRVSFRGAVCAMLLLYKDTLMPLLLKLHNYASLIRLTHTVFALPFALASVALAWPSHPVTLRSFLWILVAMVSARSAAMAFNRLADRKFDALNPRTQQWELPRGTIKVWEAVLLTVMSSVVFVYAAYQLNFVCFVLSPVALAVVFFYSLTKRFTWASHLFLGLALSLAPMGAWLAVSGAPGDLWELATPFFLGLAVLFWLAGFDVIYSLQDHEFDQQHGLFSMPVRFGVAGALRLSAFFHLLTVFFLAAVGLSARLGIIYWLGCVATALILFWEHRIVKPDDLSRINKAFFDLNAYVSIGYFLTTLADLVF